MSQQLSSDLASLRIDRSPAPPPRRWQAGLIALLAVVAVVSLTAQGLPALEARFFQVEVEVTEVASVSPLQAAVDLTATGYVVPQVTAKVGSKTIGRIVEAPVREGDAVTAGQVMFRLDPTDQERLVDTARARVATTEARALVAAAQVEEIRVQLARQRALMADSVVEKATVEDLATRLATAEAQLVAAKADARTAASDAAAAVEQLHNFVVKAPLAGTVLGKPAAVGDVAYPEATLSELADLATQLVEADVPENRLHLVVPGAPCEIALDALAGEHFPGTVVGIGPRLNRSKATATVKVRFDAPPETLRPEMSARVSFLGEALDATARQAAPKTIVPLDAVAERDGGKVVWVIEDGKVRPVAVRLGEAYGSGVELLEGPSPGTRVVKAPPEVLTDGQPVKEKSS